MPDLTTFLSMFFFRIEKILVKSPLVESKDKIQPHSQGQDQTGISKRPHWEPRTKADLRSDVIGMIFFL